MRMESPYGSLKSVRRNEGILFTLCCTLSLLSSVTTAPEIQPITKRIDNTSSQNDTESEILFSWEDYTVLAAMLVISCIIGAFYGYFGEKQTTGDEFLLGGSSMGTFPMALSLGASFITAIELLGNPAEMYMTGAQYWMICVSFLLVVPITSELYLPVFFRLRLTSCYEYLEVRFCKSVRVYASALYFMQMMLYSAVAVYAPALALSDVTGVNTYLAVTLVYVVCIFYATQMTLTDQSNLVKWGKASEKYCYTCGEAIGTARHLLVGCKVLLDRGYYSRRHDGVLEIIRETGGMKAVVMTDSFQTAVLIGSLAAVLAMSSKLVGGFDVVWEHAWQTKRLRFFDMNPDPTVRHSFWSVVIGGTMYWISMFCANQATIQKYLSVERIVQVRTALWVAVISLIAIYSVNFLTGAVLAVYYADCDPIQAGVINASDRLLPLYVVTELRNAHGVPGFFVAGIFAASLGTVAAALNSLAAIACQDLAKGLFRIAIPEDKGATIARWGCLGCGALSFALVFIVERLGPVLQLALSFNGMAGGVALGLFTLGMFFPWANAKGAVAGGIFGLIVVVTAGGGAQMAQLPMPRLPASIEGCVFTFNNSNMNPNESEDDAVFWLFRLSYLWYTGLGCLATLLSGLIVSVVTGTTDPADVPIDLISPPIVKLLNSLPKRIKTALKVHTPLGTELRRSSSLRPPSDADDKDTRRRRRLSELAGGVFYREADTPIKGYDNFALGLDRETHLPYLPINSNSSKLYSISDKPLQETSTC